MNINTNQLDQLIKNISESPKYRSVCIDFVRHIAQRELKVRKNLRIAIKTTKNKLHQIGGAYMSTTPDYGLWLKKFNAAKASGSEDKFREICTMLMRYHSSTRERLPIICDFYTKIFSIIPKFDSIVDIGCGLNPLAIPWMPIDRKVKYCAYDIYTDLTQFLNEFMKLIKIQGYAEVRDIITSPPPVQADLALILKTIPCLEQVDKRAGIKLLEKIKASYMVVSFPVKSLGGRDKDMRQNYQDRFYALLQNKEWKFDCLEFKTELVFLITK